MTAKAFKEHPIRETLLRIMSMQKLSEMTAPEVASDEITVFARDKIFEISRTLQSLLNQTPATLVHNQTVDQIQSNLQAPLSELTSFLSNKNTQHLKNAASQMEQNILPMLRSFGAIFMPSGKSESKQFIEDLQSSALQSISQLTAERNKLNIELETLRISIKKQQEQLELLAETSAKERAEAAATVSNLERQYSEKEIERNEEFDKLLNSLNLKITVANSKAEDDAKNLLEKLTELKNNASRIVQVVGDIGVTGNYQNIAKSEAEQADFWRWVTIIFFACGVGIAIATFCKYYYETIDSSNVWTIAIRLLYAIAITAPAWYTARESARHRSNSDRAKQTELELVSIGPFIELMPEDRKIEIREKLTQCYFGRDIEPHSVKDPIDIKQIKDLVVELAKAIKS